MSEASWLVEEVEGDAADPAVQAEQIEAVEPEKHRRRLLLHFRKGRRQSSWEGTYR